MMVTAMLEIPSPEKLQCTMHHPFHHYDHALQPHVQIKTQPTLNDHVLSHDPSI